MLDPVAFPAHTYGPRLRRGQVPANRMIIAGDIDERSPPCINKSLWQSVSLSNFARVPPYGATLFRLSTPWDLSLASEIDTRGLRIFVTCQSPI